MLEKTITFTDYDGNRRTEKHYFNLTNAELTKWLTTTGEATLDKVLLRLATERNGREIINIFENLLKISYGRKSDDGRRFLKNDEIWEDFHQTEGYSELFMELISDGEKTAAFVNGIMPKEVANDIQKTMRENPDGIPAEIRDYLPKPKDFKN